MNILFIVYLSLLIYQSTPTIYLQVIQDIVILKNV